MASSHNEERLECIVHQLSECRRIIRKLPNGGSDDLCQEVYARCARDASRDWRKNQRGFVCLVARQVNIDMHRRETVRRPFYKQCDVEVISGDDGPVDAFIKGEGDEVLRQGVEQLPPIYKEVILERFWKNKSPPRIAKALRIPEQTVKSRLRRALARLRQDGSLRSYFKQG